MSSTSDEQNPAAAFAAESRLPCRGCLSDCVNFASCDGRPWRTLKVETRPELDNID